MMLRSLFVLVSGGLNPGRRDRFEVAKAFYPEVGRTNRIGGRTFGVSIRGWG